ncbi:MAG: extracellular solute-binding protein [Spirochaetales bacterium]|nr:extracellular solute-binding protein [Spirochaetales bacterium]
MKSRRFSISRALRLRRREAGSSSLGKGPLLALPLGFEIYPLAYNKRIFRELGLEPPRTLEDLMDLAGILKGINGTDSFAVSLRGTEDWATIHPAHMTLYQNFVAVDIALDHGKWRSRVDRAASLEMIRYWVDLVRKGGLAIHTVLHRSGISVVERS